MTERELQVRREIFAAFAQTGAPPVVEDVAVLRSLARRHVVVLDDDRIVMAHPFAAHREGTRVDGDGRTWWGNCAWDGLGLVAALGLRDAAIASNGITVRVRDGVPLDDCVFAVLVPARRWWDDVGFT